MSSNPILEVNDLTVTFSEKNEERTVVDNVNFSINRGETIGIVGESGSGKSITALSLIKLLPSGALVKKGSVKLNDGNEIVDLLKRKDVEKYRGRNISMIFQEPMTSLNPVMTCGKQLVEAIRIHQNISQKGAKKIAKELFMEVNLPRPEILFKSYPHQLSGGQKQRVMIAMAMSSKPQVLIADEPTTALDVTVQKTILDLMKDLQKKYNTAIVFISHDLSVVANIADKILVMKDGCIVEFGTPSGIVKNPKHYYTKALWACRPSLEKRIKPLPTISDYNIKGKFITIKKEQRQQYHKEIYLNEPILRVKNLEKFFVEKKNFFCRPLKYVKAVNDVSFDVYKGETLGLVGESGCGKTTLSRTLLQLIKGGSGDIIYKGKNLRNLSKKELRKFRQKIQIIFQDPYSSLSPRMTVGEAIVEPMKVHGILQNQKQRELRAVEILKKVNLEPAVFSRYPHEFSGGQRQRIGIARALALNPELVICDESVSALDVSVQAQVLNLLNQLKDDFQLTYLFISHDLSVVKYMSDRMIVMNNGKIEEIGEADSIFMNPDSDYTKKLINSII
ncbi:MAG: ABC transporter ATP-binding protein [Bacteroidetes bacterium]|nr:MAG: ABC transporter ATP-binding protein [Bacteroidota bacterium]